MMKPDRPFPAGDASLVSTTLGWRLVNRNMPAEWTVSLGEANEQLQERFSISRPEQDEFALRSHRLAQQAWDEGFYEQLVTPVGELSRDEGYGPRPRSRSWPRSSRSSGPTARSPRPTPHR